MKHLIEISKIVTKRKVRKIEIFDDHSLRQKNSKFNEFYESLRANKFKSDRDAAEYLYGCMPTDPKYRQLKSRFRKRLLNTLFFLDVNTPATSTYDRAYYSCNKDWALVKTLIWYEAQDTAAQMARQLLTTALKFKFADIILNTSRVLRDFSALEGDENGFDTYDGYIKEYSKVLEAEMRSEELYQRVSMGHHRTGENDGPDSLSTQIESYCEELVGLSEQFDSPTIFYNMYLVWIHRYEMAQAFDAMLEVCEQGEKYIDNNPTYEQEKRLVIFQAKKMSAFLHLRNYRDGRINAEKCLNRFSDDSPAWFTFMEYYFLLAMHTENYIHAIAIFRRAAENSNFKKLSSLEQEKWNIFEAYVDYIIESEGKKNKVLLMQRNKSFNANKLINSPVIYPKSQRIFSVLLAIVQVLLLLERNTYTGLSERIERLKKHASRQLRREDCPRAIQFIRLLQQLHKADFQHTNLSGTEKYLDALSEHPFFYQGKIGELEVIPYEKLWARIMSYLK